MLFTVRALTHVDSFNRTEILQTVHVVQSTYNANTCGLFDKCKFQMGVQSIRNLYPQIGSEIFVLLQKITAKIFSLKFALVDFGKCQFLLAGVKSLEISAPVLSYCLSKMASK